MTVKTKENDELQFLLNTAQMIVTDLLDQHGCLGTELFPEGLINVSDMLSKAYRIVKE